MPDVFSLLAWAIAVAVAVAGLAILGVPVGSGVILVVLVVLLLFVWSGAGQLRHDTHSVPPGFRPTDEVFLDPATGRRTRVFVNAAGDRRYVAEQ